METANLVAFTEEILNENFIFCAVNSFQANIESLYPLKTFSGP